LRRTKKTEKTLAAVRRLDVGPDSRAGLGIDIIEIERMERILERTPRFAQRVFSDAERAWAKAKTRPATHLALFFAAKEAVLKALGTGFAGMGLGDVEVGHDKRGRPLVILHGNAERVAREQGVVEIQLSLSNTHQLGVASAVAIKQADRPRRDEKADPREELARQFKALRASLDNMESRLAASDAQGSGEGASIGGDASDDGGSIGSDARGYASDASDAQGSGEGGSIGGDASDGAGQTNDEGATAPLQAGNDQENGEGDDDAEVESSRNPL
jgi:holo-[acyl-carrier protein] synthase